MQDLHFITKNLWRFKILIKIAVTGEIAAIILNIYMKLNDKEWLCLSELYVVEVETKISKNDSE